MLGVFAGSPPRWRDDTAPFARSLLRARIATVIRPGVVWFGEALDPDFDRAMAADCDVFFTIGTSAVVYPAAGFVDSAPQGAFTVEINPDATPATSTVDLVLRGAAETILPAIAASL